MAGATWRASLRARPASFPTLRRRAARERLVLHSSRGASPPPVSAGCGTSRRRLPLCLGGFGAVRLRLRRRAARFDARARCSGVVHVGCAARRFRSVAARRGAACAVHEPCSVASRRSARALLGALARRSACSARLWRVKGRRRDAARRMRGGAARRRADGTEADRLQFRGGLTRALQAPVSAIHRHARRVKVRVARCTGRRGVGGARTGRAVLPPRSEQACKLTSASAPVQLLHDGLRERRGGSIARVGCLLCRVRQSR